MSNLAQSYITLVIGGELPIAQGNYDMKNSVTDVYMKALAEKNLGELCYIIFAGQSLKNFWRKEKNKLRT